MNVPSDDEFRDLSERFIRSFANDVLALASTIVSTKEKWQRGQAAGLLMPWPFPSTMPLDPAALRTFARELVTAGVITERDASRVLAGAFIN